MAGKPKVFVSSTIYDFADLRSALKYWLNEQGYEVRMSEFNDFIKDSNLNSYEACLQSIGECDYYILLIGSRVGGLYSKDPKISITQKEYQVANKLAEEGKIKKLLVFVRKDIWTIKEERKELSSFLKKEFATDKEIDIDCEKIVNHDSKFLNDAKFIIDFINEVGKVSDMIKSVQTEQERPKCNWINQFSTFEDIITVLKAELKIHSNLSYARWGEVVLQEIAQNLTILCYKNVRDNTLVPYFGTAYKFREALPKNMGETFTVSGKDAEGAALFGTIGCTQTVFLTSNMIEGAIESGIFLEYSSDYDDYVTGNVQRALQEMATNIALLKRISEQMDTSKITDMLQTLKINQQETMTLNSNDISILPMLSAYDCHFNIWELSRYLFAVLKFDYDVSKYPELKPRGVFEFGPDDLVWGKVAIEDVYNHFVPRE